MARTILILGATSILAQRIAFNIVRSDDNVALVARDCEELAIVAANLNARTGATVSTLAFDAVDFSAHADFGNAVLSKISTPDIILIATGALGDQITARSDERAILEIGASNFLGIATATAGLIQRMEQRGSGHIIVLSSVAGDRGRASNYVYGAAKAGMNAYFEGLRARLHAVGIRVTTIKLGFVDTQMVFGKSGMFLVADPDWIAQKISRLLNAPKDIVYLPEFWRVIMLIIRLIPEFLFKRLRL